MFLRTSKATKEIELILETMSSPQAGRAGPLGPLTLTVRQATGRQPGRQTALPPLYDPDLKKQWRSGGRPTFHSAFHTHFSLSSFYLREAKEV